MVVRMFLAGVVAMAGIMAIITGVFKLADERAYKNTDWIILWLVVGLVLSVGGVLWLSHIAGH